MSQHNIASARALFRAMDSTLSLDDAVELLTVMFENHSQVRVKPIESFQLFTQLISEGINSNSNSEWVSKMKEATSAIELIVPIVKQDFNDDLRLKAFTSILALSFAVNSNATLDYFRRNSLEIIESNRTPFVLTASGKAIAGTFLTAVMLFWIAYDQLDILDESREAVRSQLNSASETLLAMDKPTLLWMKMVTEVKFDKRFKTVLLSDGIVTTEELPNGETRLKILRD